MPGYRSILEVALATHFGIYILFIFPDAFHPSRSCLTAPGFHKMPEKG